jgi:hypothetical protein
MTMNSALSGTTQTLTFVDDAQVKLIAESLYEQSRMGSIASAHWDDPIFWNVEDEAQDRCQFLALGNTMNFRFWERIGKDVVPCTGVIDGEEFRGSMYLWRRLRLATQRGELSLDAEDLASLSYEQFVRAFADDEGNSPLRPGLDERIANVCDFGSKLSQQWGGQFINVIDAANESFDQFVEYCSSFRAFDDPVRKLTMVNAIMLLGSGLAKFDKDPLPGIDYHLVKQALRQGLVVPGGRIRERLMTQGFLNPSESLELRMAVLDALVAAAESSNISAVTLDNIYWLNRRVCADDQPLCSRCPFEASCPKRIEFGIPLEATRFY